MMDVWAAPILNRLKGIKTKNDEILSGVNEVKGKQDGLQGVVAKESTSQKILNKLNDDNGSEMFVINALLSDDSALNEWAFRQHGIGKIINKAFDLNTPSLISCDTVEEVANNKQCMAAIKANSSAYQICIKNSVLAIQLSDEAILLSGMGYAVYNVGDTVRLPIAGKGDREFTVIHKNYMTSNKIVLLSSVHLSLSTVYSDKNACEYKTSKLRSYLNSSVLSMFSDDIQSKIVTSPVIYYNDNSEIICDDKLWALSATEINMVSSSSGLPSNEGQVLDYFQKPYSNNNSFWLRTQPNDKRKANCIYANGLIGTVSVTESFFVVFAFEI